MPEPLPASEKALVDSAVGGDRKGLAGLVERFGPEARRRLGSPIPERWQSVLSVDDVMQQAYTDALLGIARFQWRGEGSFVAWLTTLARNNLLNAIRSLEADKRGGGLDRAVAHGDESYFGLFELVGGESASPSREVAAREAKAAVTASLERLPPTYREILDRHDLGGQSIEVIARDMARSPGAIHMLRARAHRLLAELLGTASRYLSRVT